jgi:hypothetical protein
MVARVLCRYLATVGGSRWVRLDAVADQTKIPQEKLIAGAAYAHMRGWAEAQWEAGRPLTSIYLRVRPLHAGLDGDRIPDVAAVRAGPSADAEIGQPRGTWFANGQIISAPKKDLSARGDGCRVASDFSSR